MNDGDRATPNPKMRIPETSAVAWPVTRKFGFADENTHVLFDGLYAAARSEGVESGRVTAAIDVMSAGAIASVLFCASSTMTNGWMAQTSRRSATATSQPSLKN